MRSAAASRRPGGTITHALLLAYGVGLWLVIQHHAAGAHEASEPPLLLHWLRDSSLALPVVAPAVWAALRLARVTTRSDRLQPLRPVVSVGAAAVAASAAFAAGIPVHAWLFGADHGGLPVLQHALEDGLHALVVALPLAVVAAALTASAFGRLAKIGFAAVAAATFGGTAYADVEGASLLRDNVGPCFNASPVKAPFQAQLPIPPTAQPSVTPDVTTDTYRIVEQRSTAEIIPGIKTPIWSYNGTFPGPTILARKGRPVKVEFVNNLPPDEDPSGIIEKTPQSEDHPFLASSTVVHLHGINTDHASDGYAEDDDNRLGHVNRHRKSPGEDFVHNYPNNEYQRPATMWYHDHSIHITSPHIYRGLAAFYLLQDAQEETLRLPGSQLADPGRGYGGFDIPLMLHDVMIDPASGLLIHDNCTHMGAFGDVMTVNGKQQPRFEVANRKYRFRLLNGSDARQYLVALRLESNVSRDVNDRTANEQFTLIGTDQGLLPAPEATDRIHTVPADRWEFVVDFSRYKVGTRLVLVNLLADPGDQKLFPLMRFDVNRTEADTSEVRPVLRPVGAPAETVADEAPAVQTRTFQFSKMNGPYWSINGQIFDRNRDDARPRIDTNEDWILDNTSGGWGHPVHIHLGRFRILKIEGRQPFAGELAGFKDVVWVGPNQRITVRHQFWNFNDRFVFHCHNGSHEDFDMMSQFNVQPSTP